MRRSVTAAALAVWVAVTPAEALDAVALAAQLEQVRSAHAMPGLRAAVRWADGREVRASVGLADVEAGVPLDNTMPMPGGSTGKTFAAALAVRLAEAGQLSFDDPASRWLAHEPWFERLPNAGTMTVGHLLSHSSGLRDYVGSVRYYLSMIWRVLRHGSAHYRPEELVAFVGGGRPLFAAGQGFHYSDAGYLVLGRVLEAAGNAPYYELLEQHVLAPAALDAVHAMVDAVLPGPASGYSHGARTRLDDGRMKFDPRSEWTGGGLSTNPTMLVRFLGGLASGRVVSAAGFRRMLEGGWKAPNSPEHHYGYGLFVDSARQQVSHGGLWPGYRTYMRHDRRTGITAAVQTNRDGQLPLDELTDALIRAAETEAVLPH